jgi:hypothetical protein
MASQALVIGVGSYAPGSEIDPYTTIDASARAYGTVLAEDERWGTDRTRVLEPEEVATADGVMRAVQRAASAADSPQDTLLVVYVGHGSHWRDVPDGQVHFAVGTSRRNEPWTWLSSWYLYRAVRQSRAGLKVLIADCCYSNMLPVLGPEATLPGSLGEAAQGTCVLTAVGGETTDAWALACPNLPAPFDACTPFSGHLLHTLRSGMTDQTGDLTLGAIRAGIEQDMLACGSHRTPRMLLNDALIAPAALFTNRVKGRTPRRAPETVADWTRELLFNGGVRDIGELLRRPMLAGQVVVRLRNSDDKQSHDLARQLDRSASSLLTDERDFVAYWCEVEAAMLGGA